MTLIQNWRQVLTGSWSTRLAFLASLLSAVELALPLFESFIPRGTFTALSAAVALAVILARVIAQPALHEPGAES